MSFEEEIQKNLTEYGRLTDLYRNTYKVYTEEQKKTILENIQKVKEKIRPGDIYDNSFKFDINGKLYDWFGGTLIVTQGTQYISNGNKSSKLKRYGIALGPFLKSKVDLTQEIPYNETIEQFIIRSLKLRDDYDIGIAKSNAVRKASGVRKNGKLVGLIKNTYGYIEYDLETYNKKKEEFMKKEKELSDALLKESGIEESAQNLIDIIKELDKSINSTGTAVVNTLQKFDKTLDDIEEKVEDTFVNIGNVIDDVGDVVGGVVNKTKKLSNKSSFIKFFRQFMETLVDIIELIITLTKYGIKLTELIIILFPMIFIVYTFFRINISLYNINDYGKEEDNTGKEEDNTIEI